MVSPWELIWLVREGIEVGEEGAVLETSDILVRRQVFDRREEICEDCGDVVEDGLVAVGSKVDENDNVPEL